MDDSRKDLDDYLDKIHLGHCLRVLRELPDDSIDAVISDPPYGLGDREPTAEDIITYLTGGGLDTGGDFMGEAWDLPSVPILRELYRVLRPGAHCLMFSSTRSWDLLSIGLRAVGFECRDTIAEMHPALLWIQREGMPKGINVRKAIADSRSIFEAPKWEGWNTALAPSWEPILVFRKPLEGRVCDNVMKHGTGALNVDVCRVAVQKGDGWDVPQSALGVNPGGNLGFKTGEGRSGERATPHAGGRWPPNMTLQHAPGCRKLGVKRVRNKSGDVKAGVGQQYKGWGSVTTAAKDKPAHKDADGKEAVEDWACVEGCPARALATQSGQRPSTLTGRADPSKAYENPGDNHGESWFGGGNSRVYADAGTATRFFPQFEAANPPFLYCPKESPRGRTLDGRLDNPHPTVKPLRLFRWLVRMVTPPGGIVLDPYIGSGTTAHAALAEGMRFVGIERDASHHETATARVRLVLGDIIASKTV